MQPGSSFIIYGGEPGVEFIIEFTRSKRDNPQTLLLFSHSSKSSPPSNEVNLEVKFTCLSVRDKVYYERFPRNVM
ncbi:hypothetical protein Y032_0080g1389 [Ancylostoma ceylanicum]|uniref:Uncharacterized protein n=1 Tax=Ancylostoma ceylanicum TaxID=53326 RepID=A0A016TTV0_9BILA|nr:hypothetical protein Y032_0080g1389 [Ancylostoma ceylanicum]